MRLGLTLVAACIATGAMAQQAAERFDAAYFAPFSPLTALDMVSRVPGFTITRTPPGQQLRGLAVNAGNVLINGEPPVTKQDDLETILARIPARNVTRLELLRSGGTGTDGARGQVVNVITNGGAGLTGTWRAGAEIVPGLPLLATGEATAELTRGATTFRLGLGKSAFASHERGPDRVFDGTGTLIERRDFSAVVQGREWTGNAGVRTRVAGVSADVGVRVSREGGLYHRDGHIRDAAGHPIGVDRVEVGIPDRKDQLELSGDFERSWGSAGATSKLALLYNRASTDEEERFTRSVAGEAPVADRSRLSQRTMEAIVRLTNSMPLGRVTMQFGGELARNRLESRFALLDTGLPASSTRVSELRAEPFLTAQWSPHDTLKVEGGLVFERSHLTVDTGLSRTLSYWKPRLIATWTPDKATTVEVRGYRDVSQLDFADFATSADLGVEGQVDAGNDRIVPEQAWTVRLTGRRTFWQRGSAELILSAQEVSDLIDRVPIYRRDANGVVTGVFDGPGNIGAGQRWNVEFAGVLPLDRLGWAAVDLRYAGHYHGTRATDPVTFRQREISGAHLHHHELALEHNGARWVWRMGANWYAAQTRYALSEIERSAEGVKLFGSVERRRLGPFAVKLAVDHALQGFRRRRDFYVGTRASDLVARSVLRHFRLAPEMSLTLSGRI